jgi:hypothetical protein
MYSLTTIRRLVRRDKTELVFQENDIICMPSTRKITDLVDRLFAYSVFPIR